MNEQKENKQQVVGAVLLLGVVILLAGLTAGQVIGWAGGGPQGKLLTKKALNENKVTAGEAKTIVAKYQQMADALVKKNNFAPPAAVAPPGECTAIMGNEAMVGGRWVKAGDRVGEAEVVEIGPTQVTLLWQGQEVARKPVLVAQRAGNQQRGPGGGNTNVDIQNRGAGGRDRIAPGLPGMVTPPVNQTQIQEQAQKAMLTIGNMAQELKNMSPEQRQQYMQEMQNQMRGGNFDIMNMTIK